MLLLADYDQHFLVGLSRTIKLSRSTGQDRAWRSATRWRSKSLSMERVAFGCRSRTRQNGSESSVSSMTALFDPMYGSRSLHWSVN